MNVEQTKPVTIGYSGENAVAAVQFDFSKWQQLYGAGLLSLIILRPKDTDAYPAPLEVDGTTATWTVSETDTAIRGHGEAQLVYIVDEQIKKSAVFDFNVEKSIMASVDPPDPYQTWLELMLAAREQAEQAAGTSEDWSEKSEDWSEESEAWAKGTKGGEPVDDEADQYHKNSKYFAEQAAASVQEAEQILSSKVTGAGLTLGVSGGSASITY